MTNSTKFAVALALILGAIVAVASGNIYNSPTDAATTLFSPKPDKEIPVRATKGDRLDYLSEIRKVAGVTVVLGDIVRTIR